MTVVAHLTLPEAAARDLAVRIGEDAILWECGLDLGEVSEGVWRLMVYFEDEPDAAERAALARQAGGGKFIFETLPETDWVAKSLEGLKPIRAGRFLVHGHHDRGAVHENDLGIEIEAGQAFGTGHHGTTAGCLRAIDQLAKGRNIRNALDLGTGSGVLAIALAKVTNARILATDIDPVAVKVAAANVKLNGVASRVTTTVADGFNRSAIERRAPYDLIVANILAGPLVKLAPAIRRHLAPGGAVILSGLLAGQRRLVSAAYRDQRMRIIDADVLDGWATLIFSR